MHRSFKLLVLTAVFSVSVHASVEQKAPQTQPGTYADTHAQQALGRVLVSSDGQFVLYEWGRPYLYWVPDTGWMAPRAARRLQTFLLKVDLTSSNPTSEYLFYPNPGCTYWLGDLAPDNGKVIVFELNHDARKIRAGTLSLEKKKREEQPLSVQWFGPQPDEGKIETMTAWISNEELIFPVADGKAPFVRASALTRETRPCTACNREMLDMLRANSALAAEDLMTAASSIDAQDVPKGARLLAGAANGSVAIFGRDDADTLSLLIKQADQPVKVLFENSRSGSK